MHGPAGRRARGLRKGSINRCALDGISKPGLRPTTSIPPVVKSGEFHQGHAPVTDEPLSDTSDGTFAFAINSQRHGRGLGLTGCIRLINMRGR